MACKKKEFYGIKMGNTEIGLKTGIFTQMGNGIRNTKKRTEK